MLLNLIKNQRPDIDKIYLHVKDPFESNYQLLINVRGKVGTKKLKNPKAIIDYSQTIDHVYRSLEYYNPTKKRRLSIVFDNMIADMESNKELSPIVTEMREKKKKKKKKTRCFYITTSFQSAYNYNASYYFIMKSPNKRELQQITSNHFSDIDFKNFMKF